MGMSALSGEILTDRLKSFKDRDIRLISDYVNSREKSIFECTKVNCGYTWKAIFNNISRGGGCPKCSISGKPIDIQRVKDQTLALNDRSIKMLGSFIKTGNKYDFQCTKPGCNHIWNTTWHSVIDGKTGCAKCAGNFVDKQTIESRILALNDRSIKMLDRFVKTSGKYDFQCTKVECQHIWRTCWGHVVNKGSGCPKCSGLYIDEYTIQKRVESLELRSVKLISSYKGSGKIHDFECLKEGCHYTWKVDWSGVFHNGSGCPKCAHNFVDKNSIQKKIDALELRSIKLISLYNGCNKHHKFECTKLGCNHNWSAKFSSVSRGTGCPKCSGRFIDESTMQKKIESLSYRSIKLISSYIGSMERHEFQCLKTKCNHTWDAMWGHVVTSKRGCPKCAGRHSTKDDKDASVYRNKIRNRISGLYKSGSINISMHKDDDYMTEILNYCKTQVNKLPTKPKGDQDWDLDHIIPVAKFNHTDLEQVKLCWNYRNLQWLPYRVNRSKSAKLMPEYFTDWHYEVLDKLGLNV